MTSIRPGAIRYRFLGAKARAFQPLIAAADRLGYAVFNRNRPPPVPGSVRSLAVIQPSGLGDIVMTLPTLHRLKTEWGGRLTLGVAPGAAAWLKGFRFVDEVLPVDIGALMGRATHPWRGRMALYRQLSAIRAEMIYEVRGDIRLTGLIKTAAPGARLGGFTCGGGGFLLDRALTYDLSDHIAEMYAALLGEFGLNGDPLRGWRPDYLPTEPAPHPLPDRFTAVHVGCGYVSNRWPKPRFVDLAKALARLGPVVMVGAPGDLDPDTSARLEAAEGVLNLVGRLSFAQSLDVIARSALFIGQDTGSTHAAVLLGRPFVALYGGFNNQRFMPFLSYENQGVVLQNRPACSGPHGCAIQSCLDNVCMTSITVDAVLEAAAQVRAAAPSGRRPVELYAKGTRTVDVVRPTSGRPKPVLESP